MLLAGASTTACGSSKDEAKPAASPSAKVPTAEELKPGLLVLSDMPTGYSAGEQKTTSTPEPNDTSSVQAGTAECDRLFNEFDSGGNGQAEVSAEFKKAATGPFVKQALKSYRDAAELQRDMGQISEAVEKCGEFTVKESDGEAKVEIDNASFPKLGDETAAFKLQATVTSGGRKVVLGGYLVAVRVGNVVSTVISFGLPTVDAAETEQITRKAVDKVTPIAK